MSGICGVWALDGSDPALAPVLAQLKRRGPDGTRVWSDGPVALGHALLATTPEALVEQMPLADLASGCTITADVRLDNREALIASLDLADETRTIGDGELILRAYLKWGEDCPTHFLGDFAFAIWDPRKTRLFCARDHMGMRQFNYCHLSNRIFAFATEDSALIAHAAVPKVLNEARIADVIDDLEGYDFTSTFFDAIRRLPPAHSLIVDRDGHQARRYWRLRPPQALAMQSDREYCDAFMSIFSEAVRCRLRNAGSIGAMLSGGLDSTSLVAVAARTLAADRQPRLKTYSVVGSDSQSCAETKAIASALAIDHLDPTLIDPPAFDRMADELLAAFKTVTNPFECNAAMLRGIYLTAREQGVNIVLDGGAGDNALTSTNRVAASLASGQLRQAWREIAGETRYWKPPSRHRFIAYQLFSGMWVAYVPQSVRKLVRKRRLSKPLRAIAQDFADRVQFIQRRLTADQHVSMDLKQEAERRAQAISHPNLTSGRERFDQLSSAYGVECRDPFMDIRLLEFCLSLPPEQVQADGWNKLILRRAIAALVPTDIAWRFGKEHLGGVTTIAMLTKWPDWQRQMRSADSPLRDYLSVKTIKEHRDRLDAVPMGLALRLFSLDRFLRRNRT